MTHIMEHDARSGGRLQQPERRFDRRRRAVADWGADDVFHAPDRHGGREARNASRFADRWNAQHAARPVSDDPIDDWLPAGTTTADVAVREWKSDTRTDLELVDEIDGPGAPWVDDARDVSELDTAELAADWSGRGPFAPAPAPRVSARDAELLDEWDPRPAPSERVIADWLQAEDAFAEPSTSSADPATRRNRRPADDWLADVPTTRVPEPITLTDTSTAGDPTADAEEVPASLGPDDGASAPNGRRTVVVRGRPDAVAASRPVVPAARRGDLGFEPNWATRPDRIAAWAAFLGFLLILVAVVTAQA